MTDHIFDEDESKAKTAKDHPQQLSDLLRNLALHTGARISIREIANALADRSFGALIVGGSQVRPIRQLALETAVQA